MIKQRIPRFARVRLPDSAGLPPEGTTIWFDGCYGTHTVELDGRYRCFKERDLAFTGDVVSDAAFLGTAHEISFDVAGPGGGRCAEGCLRLPGRFWECFFVQPVAWEEGTPWLPRIRTDVWRSGIKGHLIEVREGFACVHEDIRKLLAALLHVDGFTHVDGPDSIWLK